MGSTTGLGTGLSTTLTTLASLAPRKSQLDSRTPPPRSPFHLDLDAMFSGGKNVEEDPPVAVLAGAGAQPDLQHQQSRWDPEELQPGWSPFHETARAAGKQGRSGKLTVRVPRAVQENLASGGHDGAQEHSGKQTSRSLGADNKVGPCLYGANLLI